MIDKAFIIIRFYKWLFWIGLIFFMVSCVPQYSVKREPTKRQIYIWQEGDSLEKIAAKFNTLARVTDSQVSPVFIY